MNRIITVVATLAAKVERLRRDLQQLSDVLSPTRTQLDKLRDRVADLVLGALWDETHPLAQSAAELEERAELERRGKLYADPPDVPEDHSDRLKTLQPRRHLFMPHPGLGDPEKKKHWRAQLLLQTAALSPLHRQKVAERLLISMTEMTAAVREAAQASTDMWSFWQLFQYLEQAAEVFDVPEAALPFRLEGREFIHQSGKRVRLSPQRALFLQLLVDRVGRHVSYGAMGEAGIRNPAQIKNALLKQLREQGIELQIASGTLTYMLPTTMD